MSLYLKVDNKEKLKNMLKFIHFFLVKLIISLHFSDEMTEPPVQAKW